MATVELFWGFLYFRHSQIIFEMKTFSLAELTDRYIGPKGSIERNVFDQELRVGILGLQIKQIRIERNLTQAQLGELVGVKKVQIAKLENSPQQVRIEMIHKVVVALGAKLYFHVEFMRK